MVPLKGRQDSHKNLFSKIVTKNCSMLELEQLTNYDNCRLSTKIHNLRVPQTNFVGQNSKMQFHIILKEETERIQEGIQSYQQSVTENGANAQCFAETVEP